MRLLDIVHRLPDAIAWHEGDNIPWSEPGFSARMLHEHLTQDHDMASRRSELIDRHVDWIHQEMLACRPSKVLDLGCGPGLYTSRLARLGHVCTGVDYSPASIAHARKQAVNEALDCTYVQQDLRQAELGVEQYELAMLLFGELNVFQPAQIRRLLTNANRALVHGGILLLEPHTYAAVRKMGRSEPTWFSSEGGLFSERPHLVLIENHWNRIDKTTTVRHYVIDAERGDVVRYAQSFQAYLAEEYDAMLRSCGFQGIQMRASVGDVTDFTDDLLAIVAGKP